jgi:hypothetical protein
MPVRKSRLLHFTRLNRQKLAAVQTIASKPFRAPSVIVATEPIPKGIYKGKNQLYFYMTRYLIERLSWLCGDHTVVNADAKGRKVHGGKIPPRLEWRSGETRSGAGNEARQVGFRGYWQRHLDGQRACPIMRHLCRSAMHN